MMIGLIDVEGFVLCRGGSNRYKATTLVPFAVAALIVDAQDGSVRRSGTWLVAPRGFDPVRHAKDGATVATALARCKNRGLFQRAEERGRLDVDRVVEEVRAFLGNGALPVYARGTSIELRFLSGAGLCGAVALSRDAAACCPFPVVDLAELRDPATGDPVCPPFGGAVHDPLEELKFFAPFAARAHRVAQP